MSLSFMVLDELVIEGIIDFGGEGADSPMEDLGWFKAFSIFFKRLNTVNLNSDPSFFTIERVFYLCIDIIFFFWSKF